MVKLCTSLLQKVRRSFIADPWNTACTGGVDVSLWRLMRRCLRSLTSYSLRRKVLLSAVCTRAGRLDGPKLQQQGEMSLCFCPGRVLLGRAQLGRHSLEYQRSADAAILASWAATTAVDGGRTSTFADRFCEYRQDGTAMQYRYPQLSGRHLMWLGHPQLSDPSEWTDLYLHWPIYDGLGAAGSFISRVT